MSGVLNETYDSVRFQKGHDNITGLILDLKALKVLKAFTRLPYSNVKIVTSKIGPWCWFDLWIGIGSWPSGHHGIIT